MTPPPTPKARRRVLQLVEALALLDQVTHRGPSKSVMDTNAIPIKGPHKAIKPSFGPPGLPFSENAHLRRVLKTVDSTCRDLIADIYGYIDQEPTTRPICPRCGRFTQLKWVTCPMCSSPLPKEIVND